MLARERDGLKILRLADCVVPRVRHFMTKMNGIRTVSDDETKLSERHIRCAVAAQFGSERQPRAFDVIGWF